MCPTVKKLNVLHHTDSVNIPAELAEFMMPRQWYWGCRVIAEYDATPYYIHIQSE